MRGAKLEFITPSPIRHVGFRIIFIDPILIHTRNFHSTWLLFFSLVFGITLFFCVLFWLLFFNSNGILFLLWLPRVFLSWPLRRSNRVILDNGHKYWQRGRIHLRHQFYAQWSDVDINWPDHLKKIGERKLEKKYLVRKWRKLFSRYFWRKIRENNFFNKNDVIYLKLISRDIISWFSLSHHIFFGKISWKQRFY